MIEIAKIWKNKTECIKVIITEYKGTTFIDCRVYSKNDQGEFSPTTKGIALNNWGIDKVIDALMKARKILRTGNQCHQLVPDPDPNQDLMSTK